MASKYIKIDSEQAYQIKKDIRFSEDTFYKISQKINAYKLLRKKEMVLKNRLKVALSSLKSKVAYMESTFPEEERKNVEYTILQKQRQEKKLNRPAQIPRTVHHHEEKPQKDVSGDLEEIRKKLERFKNS